MLHLQLLPVVQLQLFQLGSHGVDTMLDGIVMVVVAQSIACIQTANTAYDNSDVARSQRNLEVTEEVPLEGKLLWMLQRMMGCLKRAERAGNRGKQLRFHLPKAWILSFMLDPCDKHQPSRED